MHRNTIALIWLAGIAVVVLAYAIDPGALLNAALDIVAEAAFGLERLARTLSVFGADMVRALAIGLFVTFAALAVLAIRQGRRGRTALLAVTVAFVLLVRDGDVSNERWAAAFVLASVAALVMTARVARGGPSPRDVRL